MPKKNTVFLVDDDIDDQEIFSFIMNQVGIHVQCVFAMDGYQALEKLKENTFNPHIIFIDINMPRMNGIELLTELKKIPKVRAIPTFMYSTAAEPEIVTQCSQLGASGFIKKQANTDVAKLEFQKIITTLTTPE